MEIPDIIKRDWEHRFPNLDSHWTHWKIMGDGGLIAVVEGLDLLKALILVEENYSRFSSIKVCRATIDESGELDEVEKHLTEITRLEYEEQAINDIKKNDA